MHCQPALWPWHSRTETDSQRKKKGDHLVIFDVIHSMTLDLFWGIFYLGKKNIWIFEPVKNCKLVLIESCLVFLILVFGRQMFKPCVKEIWCLCFSNFNFFCNIFLWRSMCCYLVTKGEFAWNGLVYYFVISHSMQIMSVCKLWL